MERETQDLCSLHYLVVRTAEVRNFNIFPQLKVDCQQVVVTLKHLRKELLGLEDDLQLL